MNHIFFTQKGWLCLILGTLFFHHDLIAQCNCHHTSIAEAGQLSPTTNCLADITPDLNFSDSTDCTGTFEILVRTLAGDTLGMGTDLVTVDLSNHLGDTIRVDVEGGDFNVNCTSFYLVEDKQDPAILSCPNDTVSCTASLDPADLKPIIVSDNCTVNPAVTFVDDTIGMNCSFVPSDFIGRIDRMFTVTDDSGNDSTCTQEIYLYRALADSVLIPPDTTIDCSEMASFDVTGFPTVNGNPIVGFCQFGIDTTDEVFSFIDGCANIIIERTWTILDCNNMLVMDSIQIITVQDTTPPTISCPTITPVGTLPDTCIAAVNLPDPTVSDDCSMVIVEAEIIGIGTGTSFSGVPAGNYIVEYTARDSCNLNDPVSCQTALSVFDAESPTAVCDGIVVVGLQNDGDIVLNAATFDDGSTDNCSPLTFLVSKNGGPFGPTIEFDCDEISGDTIMVTLQVTETQPPFASSFCMNQVVVQDKIPPIINCPADLTMDCEEFLDDLLPLGNATVDDGCAGNIVLTETDSFDLCSLGTVTRVFSTTDLGGNTSSCTQIITVENQTPFDGTGIVFPPDHTVTNGCPNLDELHPDNLPAGFDVPTLPTVSCAMLATSFDDQVFHFDFPACYKIVRTWQVMDMCQFDPADPTAGIWSAQQVIAVMDTIPPDITFCPPTDTFGLANDCGPALVTLMPVMASGTCVNENITITNDSPFADPANPGSDASGAYPEGEYVITFTATDGCGNMATCTTTILVTDLKKPVPLCSPGTITELQAMPGVPVMAFVNADHLDDGSSDNCTAAGDLIFQIKKAGTADTLAAGITFGCADEGENQVEIWVTDEAGNADFCVTTITIQDNMNLCPDSLVAGHISGAVLTMMGEEMPGVHIEIPGMGMEEMTDETGGYLFDDLEMGNDYLLEPWKNDDPLNGITTFDLLLMSKHVLGSEPLDDPYKIIAADVNNSGAITTADILELRKLVLHIYDEFPDNTSWRFVRADYVFPDPGDPFDPAFPEQVFSLYHDEEDIENADFTAVKIGDLNGTASVDFAAGIEDRFVGKTEFILDDRTVSAGEEFTVPFRFSETKILHALQFTLEFETNLELQGIEKNDLPGVAKDRFETARPKAGNAVTGLWYHTSPVEVGSEDVLFSLRFRANRAGKLSEMLNITSSLTPALAFDENGMEQDLKLLFENSSAMSFQLHQNQPNPFKKLTNIGFTLPEAGPAKLTIYDLSGSVLHTMEKECESGFNEVSVQRGELPSGGVLYYQLETPDNTATKKMILLK